MSEPCAWVLSERGLDGKERVAGIALTNADASTFVRKNNEPGCARTCVPYKIIAYPHLEPRTAPTDPYHVLPQGDGDSGDEAPFGDGPRREDE